MHSYTIIARIKKQEISARMIQGKREKKKVLLQRTLFLKVEITAFEFTS